MAQASSSVTASVARVFTQQPDRVAAAWRRVRFAQAKHTAVPSNLLDNVVEPFVRELGSYLAGKPGSPWSRTSGVLRISPERGARGLYEEFAALRRCLQDALEVLGGDGSQRAAVNAALDEAVDSSVALFQLTQDPTGESPRVPFGGLVVEFFENAAAPAQEATEGHSAEMH